VAGQINRGDFFGDEIYRFSLIKEFKNFVEVGTWNGEGSTKCFMDAILYRHDNACLYSIEANIEFYEQAKKFWMPILALRRTPGIKLNMLYGRLIEKEELVTIEEVRKHKIFNQHPWLEWRARNISEYEVCDNILEKIPEEIDVLLLDGGQFSTRAEFNKLKDRTKVVMLDDTTTFKTEKIRQELVEDSAWTVVFDDLQLRNGIFIACRTEFVNLLVEG